MANVFISFIHEEQRVAEAVQGLLKGYLCRHLPKGVFLSADDWQVFAGEIWLDRVRQELREASVVVLMLSPDSVARPWINFEAGAAWLAHKALIPVCFGGLTKGEMPKPYSGIQGLDLPDDWYYLLRSVHHHLEPKGIAIPPPIRQEDLLRELEAAIKGEPRVCPPLLPPPSLGAPSHSDADSMMSPKEDR